MDLVLHATARTDIPVQFYDRQYLFGGLLGELSDERTAVFHGADDILSVGARLAGMASQQSAVCGVSRRHSDRRMVGDDFREMR